MEQFKKPLKNEEVISLFNNLNKKNRSKLIEHNLRLVSHIIKNYYSNLYEQSNYSFDDLISIGSLGLIKAVDTFNVEKNVRFATYATRIIMNEINLEIRKNKKKSKEISTEEIIATDKEGNGLKIGDLLSIDTEIINNYLKNEEAAEILKKINELSEREKLIILKIFYLEQSQIQIAEEFGISRSYVSRIKIKALNEIKRKLH